MKKTALCFAMLMATTAFSPLVLADHDKSAKKHSTCICKGDFLQKLHLTPEQQAKIQAIRQQSRAFNTSKRQEIATIRNQIDMLSKADKLDEAKLDALVAQQKDNLGALIKQKTLTANEIYHVLDAKQKAQYDALVDAWKKKKMSSH